MLLGFHGNKTKKQKTKASNENVTYNVCRYLSGEKHLHVAYSERFCWILHSFIASFIIHLFGAYLCNSTNFLGRTLQTFHSFSLNMCKSNS